MDELDLYRDLDEFCQQEDKKSKELLALEQKYQEAIKTNEELLEDNNQLRKNIKMIEVNFQSLLDTARAELRRKQREIDSLREKYDGVCFRRIVPKVVHYERQQQQQEQQDQAEQPEQQNTKKQMDNTDKSLSKNVKERKSHSHSRRELSKILTNVELRKSLYSSTAISDDKKIVGEQNRSSKDRMLRKSNNNYSHGKNHTESRSRSDLHMNSNSFSRSRSRSRSRARSRSRSRSYAENCRKYNPKKRNRSRSGSKDISTKHFRAHEGKRQSPERNNSRKASENDTVNKHKQSNRNDNSKIDSSTTQKSAKCKKTQDGIITSTPKSSNNTPIHLSSTKKKSRQSADKEEMSKKDVLDGVFTSTLSTGCTKTSDVVAESANSQMKQKSFAKENGNDNVNGNDNGDTNTKVRNKLTETMCTYADVDKYVPMDESRKNSKNVQIIQRSAQFVDNHNILKNYTTCSPINKIKEVKLIENFKDNAIGESHDCHSNTNLQSHFLKTTGQMKNNGLTTSNSIGKITETSIQRTEQDHSVNNMNNTQKKNLNENYYAELKPLKMHKNNEKRDSICVVVHDDAISQNLSNNNMNENNEIVLPKVNVNMNGQQEEKTIEAVHPANKLELNGIVYMDDYHEEKIIEVVHSTNRLQSRNNANMNVQQVEEIIEIAHLAKHLQPEVSVDIDVQEKENTTAVIHQANELQQALFNENGNESGNRQKNGHVEKRIHLDEYKIKSKISTKDLNAAKTSLKNPNDIDGSVPLVTHVPIIEQPSYNTQEMANMDDLLSLPSVKNIPMVPTNFSGIFTKNLFEMSLTSSSSSSSICDSNAANMTTAAKPQTITAITKSSLKKEESSDLLKVNEEQKTLPKYEYILPAVNVLCNVDNLENATKVTEVLNNINNKKSKKDMAKKKRKCEELVSTEDNAIPDNTESNYENENDSSPLKISPDMIMDVGRFACLENLTNFNSNSDREESEEEEKIPNKTMKKRKIQNRKIKQNLEKLFSSMEESNKNIAETELNEQAADEIVINANGKKSLCNGNEIAECIANKNNIETLSENENKLKKSKMIKTVQKKMKRLGTSKNSVCVRHGDKDSDIAVKFPNVHEPTTIKSSEIVKNENERSKCEETPMQCTFVERTPPKVVPTNNVEIIAEDEYKTKNHSEINGIISETTEDINVIKFSNFTTPSNHIKTDKVQTDKESINHSTPISPPEKYEKYDFNINQLKEKTDVSTNLLHKLLLSDEDNINNNNKNNDDDVSTVYERSPPRTPSDMGQDEVFKQIDTKMHELFQSPQCQTFQKQQQHQHQQRQQQQQHQQQKQPLQEQQQDQEFPQRQQQQYFEDCVNDKLPISTEAPKDACINSNQENDQRTLNVTLPNCSTHDPIETNLSTSLPSSSLNDSNVKEIKYMSMGSSVYRFEKISNNLVKLFITRNHKRKT